MLQYAQRVGDLRLVKRILAVLSISDGIPYRVIAKTHKVSEEDIRLWVNALLLKGIEGLISNKGPGRPPRLTKTQKKNWLILSHRDLPRRTFMQTATLLRACG